MGRWIAIGRAPGWEHEQRFSTELKATPQWRPDAKSSVTTVYALADGRLIAEFHGSSQADFEAWLRNKAWEVESITALNLIAKCGDIWKLT